jgi:hypothetical protein
MMSKPHLEPESAPISYGLMLGVAGNLLTFPVTLALRKAADPRL